tara:strand:+ start:184 stop:528 length:345 start_codon:yes stop_codon:yes gene_type:complete
MEEKPNAWIKNKVKNIKVEDDDEYKPDTRLAKIFAAKEEYARKRRHENFQQWLGEYNEKNIQIKEMLNQMCKEVFITANKNGYTITNEKRLRDEIATFVYKEASYHAEERNYKK